MKHCVICTLNTPVGLITVCEYHKGVVRVDFDNGTSALNDIDIKIVGRDRRFFEDNTPDIPTKKLFFDSAMQLCEYFVGMRNHFDLPVVVSAKEGTFKREVLEQLNIIPFGQTVSYMELATKAKKPKAYRAAATVIANNKTPIILPCHRVINSNGKVGKFIAGTEVKQKLLNIEQKYHLGSG